MKSHKGMQEKKARFIHRQRKTRRQKNLVKISWLAMKANSNFMHNQLLSPLINIFPIDPPPPPNPLLPN